MNLSANPDASGAVSICGKKGPDASGGEKDTTFETVVEEFKSKTIAAFEEISDKLEYHKEL